MWIILRCFFYPGLPCYWQGAGGRMEEKLSVCLPTCLHNYLSISAGHLAVIQNILVPGCIHLARHGHLCARAWHSTMASFQVNFFGELTPKEVSIQSFSVALVIGHVICTDYTIIIVSTILGFMTSYGLGWLG